MSSTLLLHARALRARALTAGDGLGAMALTWVVAAWIALVLVPSPAMAADAPLTAINPALESRVQRITAELRCLVCQNQTVADSHADLANDLRRQVRDMVQQGKTDTEILSFMTARYGDFVLYRPPVKSTTMLLWAGPAALLVLAVLALVLVVRRRQRLPDTAFEPDQEEATR